MLEGTEPQGGQGGREGRLLLASDNCRELGTGATVTPGLGENKGKVVVGGRSYKPPETIPNPEILPN